MQAYIPTNFRSTHTVWCLLLFAVALSTPAQAQIPPLPSNPPTYRPPPRKKSLPGLFGTSFARGVFQWAKALRKKLPKGWEMQWDASRLRPLGWMASDQQGYRIRFSHKKEKVVVPVPFPTFGPQKAKRNVRLIFRRCSLHFFPRRGRYTAHHSLIARMPPAAFITVTPNAVVLQANRFQAMEYPCPKLLKLFHAYVGIRAKGRAWKTKRRPWNKRRWLRKATLHKHHLTLQIKSSQKGAVKRYWKKLLKLVRKKTLLVQIKAPSQKEIVIYNLRKK